ncbi:hypothetical protein FLONG3_1841 [Fusarium longipes]|uniref:Uncharacterized protein n=1 Tax=Fusarium longipes TaxID=694270 RepID=A0A395T5W3_9HYPO|nr:hypothetical protein FLONG3_1841 [Fusarium longipes]
MYESRNQYEPDRPRDWSDPVSEPYNNRISTTSVPLPDISPEPEDLAMVFEYEPPVSTSSNSRLEGPAAIEHLCRGIGLTNKVLDYYLPEFPRVGLDVLASQLDAALSSFEQHKTQLHVAHKMINRAKFRASVRSWLAEIPSSLLTSNDSSAQSFADLAEDMRYDEAIDNRDELFLKALEAGALIWADSKEIHGLKDKIEVEKQMARLNELILGVHKKLSE